MTLDKLLAEINARHRAARHNMRESRVSGTNTPRFNQDLGYYDALGELLKWIEDEENRAQENLALD